MPKRYKYAKCRSRVPGHDWHDPDTGEGYAGTQWVPSHGFGVEERCPNCGTVRHCIIDIRGEKSPWVYTERPLDYSTDLTMAELRLIVVAEKKSKRRHPSRSGGAEVIEFKPA